MRMAQVTDNPAMADGSSLHQQAKQQLQYLRTYIQPLLRAGKPLELKDILHHVTIRKPKLVQQLGMKQVQHMAQMLLDQELCKVKGSLICRTSSSPILVKILSSLNAYTMSWKPESVSLT